MDPLISVVVPLYNRAAFVGRTLESCIAQTCGYFEIIVVDDGSTDESCAVVERYTDKRIRLIRQGENRGVGPARNLGVDSARADWIVMLDSDDELVSNAIEIILKRIESSGSEADAFLFRCRLDDGTISPSVMRKSGRLTYIEYLEHINACSGRKRDVLYCVRRSTFATVRYPPNFGLEDLYHLDFNKTFRTMLCEDVLRLYHQDADNQLVKRVTRFDKKRDDRFARDRAGVVADALRIHGTALRRHAPHLHEEFVSRLLMLSLQRGSRATAFETLGLAFKHRLVKPSYIVAFTLGVFHPSLLPLGRSLYRRLKTAAPTKSLGSSTKK